MDAVNVLINQPGKSTQPVVIFGGILVLLLLVAGLYMVFGFNKSAESESFDISGNISKLETQKKDIDATVLRLAQEGGMTAEEAQEELDKVQAEAAEDAAKCGFYPMQGDVCRRNFAYDPETKCCNAVPDKPQSKEQIMLAMAAPLLRDIIIGECFEALIKYGAKKIAQRAVTKLAMKLAGKMAVEVAEKVAAKVLAKLVACAASGPVGWALFAFDVLSMAIDMLDPRGYDLYTANSILENRDKNSMFTLWQQQMLNNADWPVMVPLNDVYGDLYNDYVLPAQNAKYMGEATGLMCVELPRDELDAVLALDLGIPANVDLFFDAFQPFYELSLNGDTEARDKFIFDTLQDALKGVWRHEEIFLCPEMSATARVGISLSKEKCEKWNKKHLPVWTWYVNDLTGSPNKYITPNGKYEANVDGAGKDLPPPIFADWTDWYYLPNEADMAINGFKEGNPSMLIKSLERSVSLYGGMKFMSYVMCIGKQERKGQKGKEDITVYPAKYGVNWTNGMCNYTKKYCDKMKLSFKGKEYVEGTNLTTAGYKRPTCYMNTGQNIAESVFGSTITREYIAWGQDIKKCASKNATASACANALMGPIVKAGVGLLSTTGKNMGKCFQGNAGACENVITDGPLSVPGKLLGGLGHGMAGMSASIGQMVGDEAYTAFITAPFTAMGEAGDILADPLGAIMRPLETAETILSMPADIWNGIADTLDTIPVVGEAIAFVIYAITDLYSTAVNQVLDMENVTATWWCPACMGVKLVWKGFRAAFGIKPDKPPEQLMQEWKSRCLTDETNCKMKWAGMESSPEFKVCERIGETCPLININTYETIGWGGVAVDPTEHGGTTDTYVDYDPSDHT